MGSIITFLQQNLHEAINNGLFGIGALIGILAIVAFFFEAFARVQSKLILAGTAVIFSTGVGLIILSALLPHKDRPALDLVNLTQSKGYAYFGLVDFERNSKVIKASNFEVYQEKSGITQRVLPLPGDQLRALRDVPLREGYFHKDDESGARIEPQAKAQIRRGAFVRVISMVLTSRQKVWLLIDGSPLRAPDARLEAGLRIEAKRGQRLAPISWTD